MTTGGWYKISHGLPQDPRLAVIARRANVSRAEALALWVALLDHASQAKPRGSLAALDAEALAAALDLAPAAVEQALQTLRDKNVVTAEGVLAGWEKSQKLSTARTRAWRARRKRVLKSSPYHIPHPPEKKHDHLRRG